MTRFQDATGARATCSLVWPPLRRRIVPSDSCSWAAMASRWRSSFPGPSSTGSESEHALQDFREPVARLRLVSAGRGRDP
jgi:hypothetical protein